MFDMRSNEWDLSISLFACEVSLTHHVAIATVERSFSAKNELHNLMEDQWMNDCLVVYIEKDVAYSIDNETII